MSNRNKQEQQMRWWTDTVTINISIASLTNSKEHSQLTAPSEIEILRNILHLRHFLSSTWAYCKLHISNGSNTVLMTLSNQNHHGLSRPSPLALSLAWTWWIQEKAKRCDCFRVTAELINHGLILAGRDQTEKKTIVGLYEGLEHRSLRCRPGEGAGKPNGRRQ